MTPRLLILSLLALSVVGPVAPQPAPQALSIVLPPQLLANRPATLAVLGPDGHLAVGVIVNVGDGQRLITDAIGRATFVAPPDGALLAVAQGVSAAALVDAAPSRVAASTATIAPDVSQRDRFAICGSGFSANVGADTVTINGDRAFVLAASPICVVVLAQSRTLAGAAKIEIDTPGTHATASTSLVALDFFPPGPPLQPGHKGKLFVRAEGTADPLHLIIENHSPDVIRFIRGKTQDLRTSGGLQNQAAIQVQAIRSGEFSFHARIAAPANTTVAARYLEIAESVAPKGMEGELKAIASGLAHHPRDDQKARAALERLANSAPAGSLRTLIEAADDAL
ncbi:MAG TPA: hypothetical protein VMB47_12890 [Candidatus Aquilonibacter sp.]|nr:hypothetical protein [Candidatus Aquilonibacter sp.]